jgi:hypothetical protein
MQQHPQQQQDHEVTIKQQKKKHNVKTTTFLASTQMNFDNVILHGVQCAGFSDFSVRGTAWRNISRQLPPLFRREFRR